MVKRASTTPATEATPDIPGAPSALPRPAFIGRVTPVSQTGDRIGFDVHFAGDEVAAKRVADERAAALDDRLARAADEFAATDPAFAAFREMRDQHAELQALASQREADAAAAIGTPTAGLSAADLIARQQRIDAANAADAAARQSLATIAGSLAQAYGAARRGLDAKLAAEHAAIIDAAARKRDALLRVLVGDQGDAWAELVSAALVARSQHVHARIHDARLGLVEDVAAVRQHPDVSPRDGRALAMPGAPTLPVAAPGARFAIVPADWRPEPELVDPPAEPGTPPKYPPGSRIPGW